MVQTFRFALTANEDQIAIRGGRIYAPRLAAARSAKADPAHVRSDATYLITGGTGGIALKMAAHLVSRGARSLVLLSRRGLLSETARPAVEGMRASGADLRIVSADVASDAQLERVFADIDRSLPPLAGIIHAAGVLDDGILLNLDRERFESVFRAKSVGAWNLHQLAGTRPLDFFVLCSSAAALVGSPGQGNYVAANAFLDALATDRTRAGQPTLAIAWGLWDGEGLAGRIDARHQERLAALGFLPLHVNDALQAFDRLLSRSGHMAVVRADWPVFAAAHPRQSVVRAFLPAGATGSSSPRKGWFRDRLANAGPDQQLDLIVGLVRVQAAAVMRCDADRISLRRGFFDQGMDSLLAMQLRTRLEVALDLSLPATLTFDYPDAGRLAAHLFDRAGSRGTRPAATVPPETSAASVALDEVIHLSPDELAALIDRELDLLQS